MTDEPESQEDEDEIGVEPPQPISLTAPDGTTYVITCEATICGLLGVESIPAYRATDAGLEWLTEKRRWEPVEAPASGPAKVVPSRKN